MENINRNIRKKEFNKIAEAEKWLSEYNSTKSGIESLKERYKILSDAGSGLDVSRETTGKTNKFNSEVENLAVELSLIDSRIKNMELKIKQIDRALNSLSNIERQVIDYKCIEGMYYYEFTYKVYRSERQCKRIKSMALRKIATALGF